MFFDLLVYCPLGWLQPFHVCFVSSAVIRIDIFFCSIFILSWTIFWPSQHSHFPLKLSGLFLDQKLSGNNEWKFHSSVRWNRRRRNWHQLLPLTLTHRLCHREQPGPFQQGPSAAEFWSFISRPKGLIIRTVIGSSAKMWIPIYGGSSIEMIN